MEDYCMSLPTGLKIGDTFEEKGTRGPVLHKIIGFDGQGHYVSVEVTDDNLVPVEELVEEELPFTIPDDELVEEEQPVVEEVKEVKKAAPKKTATRKKTVKKTSKK